MGAFTFSAGHFHCVSSFTPSGGIASNDPAAQVSQETAIVSMAGRRETIDMRLSMRSVRSDAALIVPTPAPATVSAGDSALFDKYEAISAPRTETRRHWWSRSSDYDGARAGALPPGSAAGGDQGRPRRPLNP